MNAEWNNTWPDKIKAAARTMAEVRALPHPNTLVRLKCIVHEPITSE